MKMATSTTFSPPSTPAFILAQVIQEVNHGNMLIRGKIVRNCSDPSEKTRILSVCGCSASANTQNSATFLPWLSSFNSSILRN
jgi:hypothetical protein